MSRKRLPATLVVVLTGVVLLSRTGALAAQRPDRSPNIVLIISDDQTWTDFGFMGHPHVRTPALDALAARSARFVNGYVPSSVCRPSLVTLLTGLYPHQHGVHFNHPPPGFAKLTRSPEITKARYDALRDRACEFIRTTPTLPRALAEHGYACLQTGKYWEGHWRNAAFTHGMTTAEPSPEPAWGNKQLASGDIVAHGNGDAGLAIGRATMQPIEDFIDTHGDRPFFIWYAPFLPHLPHDAPERFRRPYEADPDVPAHRVPYYASCSQFDETVGQLVEMIEQRGLADDTLFLFVVDNGFEPDADRPMPDGTWNYTKRSKRSPFEPGLKTPILIRWDGHVQSATHASPCSSVDVVPTLLHAVGIPEAIDDLPGQSLLPAASGDEELASRPVFGGIYPGDATALGHPERDIAYRWVREGNFKLIVPHTRGSKLPWGRYLEGPALFNVADDPRESVNLIDAPAHAMTRDRLRRLLDEWWLPDQGANRTTNGSE
ncbi:Choline-sulfatase [Maioricimonas rarisocia]|uniref:Choline-sulfatase n=1 Tax=Maioricimonas rarisocia TaxID=2528026 RepID=A0A517Z638_9PLAN|nr:sulfatase-like hydrolase/transferase [Maioricimonas rarisocia]QDU37943.1 Choline-sulfatase [Maioricimonas rarisocia]